MVKIIPGLVIQQNKYNYYGWSHHTSITYSWLRDASFIQILYKNYQNTALTKRNYFKERKHYDLHGSL